MGIIPFNEHTQQGQQSFMFAAAYAEGRIDGGDDALVKMFALLSPEAENPQQMAVLAFANWVASRADNTVLGFDNVIAPLKVMYPIYVKATAQEAIAEQARRMRDRLRHPSNWKPDTNLA